MAQEMKEIECKIMGMCLERFIEIAQEYRLTFVDQKVVMVEDTYWENADGKTIRHRKETYDVGKDEGLLGDQETTYMDLTIKGSEENDGEHISEREEIILKMNCISELNITTFLSRIGFKPAKILLKERNIFIDGDDNSPIRVHHDKFFLHEFGIGPFIEWVEIEGDTKGDLYEFLFKMGINREDISNKTTLDIINEHQE